MTGADPLTTRRETGTSLAAELAAAGFEDAVEVGRGGFGAVYRCAQKALDRTVAVKVLTAELDKENRARFLREQQAMGRLTGQPNIVTVLEVGVTDSGRPYLVTPYYPMGSLDAWIRQHGPLPAEDVLEIGRCIAGALDTAHRLGVVHRDLKPGNILLAEHGEPALTDFGIAHMEGAFRTTAGTVTGSPAFTAPEVLEGHPPTPSADVYGLGATMFCALTGHAAFERRTGENMVTQFLRITTQSAPDLRENGVAADVSTLVESAMSRDSAARPSAAEFAEAIRQMQQQHAFLAAGAITEPGTAEPQSGTTRSRPPVRRPNSGQLGEGNLPLEMTSLVGRRTELAEVKNLLAGSRLVTLTGVGGVGKTRLVVRAAAQVADDFADGAWLIELADVTDGAILADIVAAVFGLRNESPTPLSEALVEYLCPREVLLVLDNCEHLVEAVAELDEILLQACPRLRVLATSREPLNIAGEAVLRVAPLTAPEPGRVPSLRTLSRYDAVTLFVDRAAAAVPGFELDEENKDAVAAICARLDGLPLAVELAAARMRTMSPEQILQRLDDRYALLNRATRTAPTRQQTLRLSIDWSFDLCTPAEQQLWAQLSVFAGSCELDAVEAVCDIDPAPHVLLDVLSSLVDKSVLVREEFGTAVRFVMLETLRDYGRQILRESSRSRELQRRHRDWYQQMLDDATESWISARQPEWIARLEREQSNLREALEFCLAESTEAAADAGLRMAAALFEFWNFRGLLGEGRSWLDRILARPGATRSPHRVRALCAASKLASMHGEFGVANDLVQQARALTAADDPPALHAQIAYAEGVLGMSSGRQKDALTGFGRAVELTEDEPLGQIRISALTLLGWTYELGGTTIRAGDYYRRVLAVTEPRGEVLHRAAALRGLGVAAWQTGDADRARHLLTEALRVNSGLNSTVLAMHSLEALAWVCDTRPEAERAAILLGAAERLLPAGTKVSDVFHNLARFHDETERRARRDLGDRRYRAAFRKGRAMNMDSAVQYALGETGGAPATALTKREHQVAELVAQGLSNKQIAAKLMISLRTAQGHVEHILSKLGFTSRTQIAAWVAHEEDDDSR